MADFILPSYKGIEEVMQDVRVYARDKGHEKAIGLLPNGERVFDVTGNEGAVELPAWAHGKREMFVIHGHPRLPNELSDADIRVIKSMECAGNMAVCDVDDTVSWTTGIDFSKINGPIGMFFADLFMHGTSKAGFEKLDPGINERIKANSNSEPWPDLDDRWIVLSHITNRHYVKSGFLRDYHVRHGAVELEALGKWLPKLGIEMVQ